MSFARLIVLSLGAMSVAVATAAPVTLYDGSAAPIAQGWTRSIYLGTAGTETVGAGTTQFTTVNNPVGGTSQLSTYAYATGATNFIASIRLEVISSSHNPFDAGLTFSAFGLVGTDIQNDRSNNLMIDSGVVLWGDEGASAAVSNASGFHEYAFRYLNGTLSVYFDASFADIEAGTATSILTRTTAPASGYDIGTIVFGDATNDPDYNSNYAVDFVSFQNLDVAAAVPEPGTMALVLGVLPLAALMRRRRA